MNTVTCAGSHLSRPELEPKVLETLERIVELSQELRKEYDQWDPTG